MLNKIMILIDQFSDTHGQVHLYPKLLSFALLDVVRKGFVRQIDEKSFEVIRRDADYRHERHLIHWLFYKIGEDGRFSMDDLKAYSEDEKQAENYQEDFSKWMNFVKAEVDSYDLYENTVKLRILLAAFKIGRAHV